MSAPLGHRLLVVEDDPAFARTLVRRLEADGHAVTLAGDGRDGMKAIVAYEPHLVISDWMMPHLDGLELCRAVKTGLGEVAPYFVLLTARDDINARMLALETGADDFLVKPCHEGELAARVRSGLRQVSLRARIRELASELERFRAGAPGQEAPAPVTLQVCDECGRGAVAGGAWQQLSRLVPDGGQARFEHAACPECSARRRNARGERRSRAA